MSTFSLKPKKSVKKAPASVIADPAVNDKSKSSKKSVDDDVIVNKGKKKISVVAEKAPVEGTDEESDFEDYTAESHVSEQEEDSYNQNDIDDEECEGNGNSSNPNKKSKIESRQEAKKVKLERQAHRPHNDLVQSAKKLWEKVRRRDQPANERAGPMAELFVLLTGKFKEIIMKHDASRMIQTCVKYGSPAQRLQIALELKGIYAELAKNRYGKHIVKRLLQYCPSVRKSIVSEFRGQVSKLIRHADASSVLEEIYSEYANGRDRNGLLLEFYGLEYVLFQKRSGDEVIPSLSEILSSLNGSVEKKEKILKYLREALDGLVNKGSLQHTMIHRLMLEYVLHEETSKLQDWISTFEEKLVEILHTFEGARVVAKCLAVATAKQRKNIIKSFKTFVNKIAKEEYGHQVLLVAFAVVDDTVLMRSVVISELVKNLREYLNDKHANRLILYLLATATESTNSVLPSQAVQLIKEAQMSAKSAGTSKKDSVVRANELRSDLVEPLGDLICAEEIEDIENDSENSFRLERMIENSSKHSLLIESALSLEIVGEKLIKGPASDLENYEQVQFRSLMKKWARKCTLEQGKKYLETLKSGEIMKKLIESESAYIFSILIQNHVELKEFLLPRFESLNEHALALYQKFE